VRKSNKLKIIKRKSGRWKDKNRKKKRKKEKKVRK
jgi:hypothetical protein